MKRDYLKKYNAFIKIAKVLNENGIVPLLFGSLGLTLRIISVDYKVDDIDILVNKKYLTDEWDNFKRIIEQQGYVLEDLHEHQFRKNNFKIAFADIESLTSFANIVLESIELKNDKSVKYFLLDSEQYLSVYKASSKDSYRRNKNNNKDLKKIELIYSFLNDEIE